jgi:hypothetical protein
MRIKYILPCVLGSVVLLACRKSAVTSATGAGGTTSATASVTTSYASSGTMGTGTGGAMCAGDPHTIQEVTSGTLGSGTVATLQGVVAMSGKFLVSSKTSCLWGVFVSAPGLTETAENTGLLALSYGTPPMVPAGGTKAYCPEQGVVPAGDSIPDNVAPGDVLDIIGTTASFPTTFTTCVLPSNPVNSIPMRQFTNVCSVTKTGTATPPKAHLLTGADVMSLSDGDGTNQASIDFHNKWGGVKVRVEMAAVQPGTTATSTPAALTDCDTGLTPPCTVRGFGNIVVGPGMTFGDKMYYRGYQKDSCHSGPVYASSSETFAFIEGFHYLDFCTWALEINDRCADVSPPPDDCLSAMPPVTSCAGK